VKRYIALIGIIIVLVWMYTTQGIGHQTAAATVQEQLVEVEQSEVKEDLIIEEPFTMIINHSVPSYGKHLKISAEQIEGILEWTDVNGVEVIDIGMGNTFVRILKAHIEGKQLHLYAPYLYVDEEWPSEG
jgi:hypothetical protein